MSGVNKAIIVGHLGRDPEVRTSQSGARVVTFSVATGESWRDKQTGERKERTEWHNVVVFNDGLGKIAEQYLRKGSKVYLEGQIRTREYTDRDGNARRTSEIVLAQFRGELTLLDSAKRPAPEEGDYGKTRARETPATPQPRALNEALDDDIPF